MASPPLYYHPLPPHRFLPQRYPPPIHTPTTQVRRRYARHTPRSSSPSSHGPAPGQHTRRSRDVDGTVRSGLLRTLLPSPANKQSEVQPTYTEQAGQSRYPISAPAPAIAPHAARTCPLADIAVRAHLHERRTLPITEGIQSHYAARLASRRPDLPCLPAPRRPAPILAALGILRPLLPFPLSKLRNSATPQRSIHSI